MASFSVGLLPSGVMEGVSYGNMGNIISFPFDREQSKWWVVFDTNEIGLARVDTQIRKTVGHLDSLAKAWERLRVPDEMVRKDPNPDGEILSLELDTNLGLTTLRLYWLVDPLGNVMEINPWDISETDTEVILEKIRKECG